MSAPKHTPGPWQFDSEEGVVFATFDGGKKDRDVCEVSSFGVPMSRTAIANAHLIAAAPDLLAVANEASRESVLLHQMNELVEARSAADPCGDGLFGIGAHKDEHALKWQALREELNALVYRRLAAIAKAEGRS